MSMSEAFAVLLKFGGVTLMALITACTVRLVVEMCGPEGEEGVRRMREKLFRD